MADEQFPAAATALEEYQSIEEQMASPEVVSNPDKLRKLGRRHAELGAIVGAYKAWLQVKDASCCVKPDSDERRRTKVAGTSSQAARHSAQLTCSDTCAEAMSDLPSARRVKLGSALRENSPLLRLRRRKLPNHVVMNFTVQSPRRKACTDTSSRMEALHQAMVVYRSGGAFSRTGWNAK